MAQHPQDRRIRSFERTLNQLNSEQRQAVEKIDGPMMVLAGPGTGKTHMLAARVGNILLNTDTDASSILCLTFTDAAVYAIRDRLLRFIGPAAHRVHISTFHSFGSYIIQKHAERFGLHEMEAISELERVELLEKLLKNLPPAHPLRAYRAEPTFYQPHLRHLFSLMRREGWTVSDMNTRIDQYLQELPQRPEFQYKRKTGSYQPGDLKEGKYNIELRRMERLKAAVKLMPSYEAAKQKMGRYDYSDMLAWVLQAFAEDEILLKRYQEQYLYVLVDEFQDTNGVQAQLVRQLMDYWESPNLFIVGDDDQAIYEFQGARMHNLEELRQHFQPDILVLQRNYRSPKVLLEAANTLIANNTLRLSERMNINKALLACGRQKGIAPRLTSYADPLEEEAGLIEELKKAHHKGIAWQEMAIIYARHTQATSLPELLQKAGIPVRTKRPINVLDQEIIRQIRTALAYFMRLVQPGKTAPSSLYAMANAPYSGLTDQEVFDLGEQLRQEGASLSRLLDRQDGLTSNIVEWLKNVRAISRAAQSLSVIALLDLLIDQLGILHYILHLPDSLLAGRILQTFRAFVARENRRHPRMTLSQLLITLERMDRHRISLPLETIGERTDGVLLTTAHGAKGLEFDWVCIWGATEKYWDKNGKNSIRQLTLPDTITYSMESDAEEARRRLFFVALTRAKKELIISVAQQDEHGTPLTKSQFVDELLEANKLNIDVKSPAKKDVEEQLFRRLLPEKTDLFSPDQAWLNEQLQNFRLSVTSLNTYLRCPNSFYHQYVLQLPLPVLPERAYGQALHVALQLYAQTRLTEQTDPGLMYLQETFVRQLNRIRASLHDQGQYDHYLETGKAILQYYYNNRMQNWPLNMQIELDIRFVEVKGVPIAGIIDRIDRRPEGEATLIDYKTGSYRPADVRPPNEKEPLGGQYWRQMAFYQQLYNQYTRGHSRATLGKIEYLRPTSNGKYKDIDIKLDKLSTQLFLPILEETWLKIQEHDFFQLCDDDGCYWCQLQRARRTIPGEIDFPEVGLDDQG